VGWQGDIMTATVELGDVALAVKIGELLPGMDVAAMIEDSRTMVPLRFVSEALGGKVVWNPVDNSIDITR